MRPFTGLMTVMAGGVATGLLAALLGPVWGVVIGAVVGVVVATFLVVRESRRSGPPVPPVVVAYPVRARCRECCSPWGEPHREGCGLAVDPPTDRPDLVTQSWKYEMAPTERWRVLVVFGPGDSEETTVLGTKEQAREKANTLVSQRCLETGDLVMAEYSVDPE